jgi:nitrate reductase gamma subunit
MFTFPPNLFNYTRAIHYVLSTGVRKVWNRWDFIYYLHYMLHMFTPTLYPFSQPLYHVSVDFAQHIGIDSRTTVYNYLPKVTKISDFNSIHHP